MGTHKIYSGIQGIRDNISGSLYGDCHELLAHPRKKTGACYAGYSLSGFTSFVVICGYKNIRVVQRIRSLPFFFSCSATGVHLRAAPGIHCLTLCAKHCLAEMYADDTVLYLR